jgi:hypothetical protein
MSDGPAGASARLELHPHAADIDAERLGWYEVVGLIQSLRPEECLEPGYYRDPDWTVRDVVAHLGTWLAEAAIQFERIQAGTYEGHDIDIDALNESFVRAMVDQPWDVARAPRSDRRGGVVDPEIGGGPLRGAPAEAA